MKDREYQQKIEHFWSKQRRMPSYAEIMKITGFRSRASVFKLIQRLLKQGAIKKDRNNKILPGDDWGTTTVLGLIEAGFPSPQEEYRSDAMSLDDYLIPEKESSYLLKVKGDSMKDAGIIEGDMVIAERGREARSGNIVIARIDGEYTMKYYRTNGKSAYLEAANKSYRPMHPKRSLEIEAVVRGVIRKYK